MEIDLLDPSYLLDHYIAIMPSWLVNIYTGLTERLIAMEKLVSELATRDCLATTAFPGLIVQYWQLLQQQHAIYKPAQEDKSQFEKMSDDEYALQEQSNQNFGSQVDGGLITIRQESQELFTPMQNMVNTQIADVAAMQWQTEIFVNQIDQEMDVLHKKLLQSFALSSKAEKTTKSISKRKVSLKMGGHGPLYP
jgi:hypothetical protein